MFYHIAMKSNKLLAANCLTVYYMIQCKLEKEREGEHKIDPCSAP